MRGCDDSFLSYFDETGESRSGIFLDGLRLIFGACGVARYPLTLYSLRGVLGCIT